LIFCDFRKSLDDTFVRCCCGGQVLLCPLKGKNCVESVPSFER
jgi:hypothetical protein